MRMHEILHWWCKKYLIIVNTLDTKICHFLQNEKKNNSKLDAENACLSKSNFGKKKNFVTFKQIDLCLLCRDSLNIFTASFPFSPT